MRCRCWTCAGFGSAFLKSRSSSSFPAEVKYFIAPQPVNISNCGEIKVIKRTDPRGINQNFGYTSDMAGAQLDCSADPTPASFTLNDSAGVDSNPPVAGGNVEDCKFVPLAATASPGGAEPSGFVLESLACQATGSSSGTQDGTDPFKANITLAGGNDVVTCTYVNQQQLGAIKITRTSSKAVATPLAGVKFSITSGGTPLPGSPFTTGSNGVICVDGLSFGDYVVTETAAPSGYAIDDTTSHTVTVDNNAKCSDATYVGESIGFTDTPLTDLLVKATSEAPGGTQSKIACVDSASNDIGNSPQGFGDPVQVTANGLKPGTYTCTVIIDP